MPTTVKVRKAISADEIAAMAERSQSVSRFFTNSGKMMQPIQRVNVDFAIPMLKELDEEARALNISRQAVIKSLLRQALDQQRLARRMR
jgi:Ribbon-helix-helix protein, copG family